MCVCVCVYIYIYIYIYIHTYIHTHTHTHTHTYIYILHYKSNTFRQPVQLLHYHNRQLLYYHNRQLLYYHNRQSPASKDKSVHLSTINTSFAHLPGPHHVKLTFGLGSLTCSSKQLTPKLLIHTVQSMTIKVTHKLAPKSTVLLQKLLCSRRVRNSPHIVAFTNIGHVSMQ